LVHDKTTPNALLPGVSLVADREVMISYAAAMRLELAALVRDKLAELGTIPRMDQIDIVSGRPWRSTINAWLDSCDFAVILLTPAAMRSAWVQFEVNILTHRFWRDGSGLEGLIVVLLDGVAREDLRLSWAEPGQLAEVHIGLTFGKNIKDEEVVGQILAALERVAQASGSTRRPTSLEHRARYHARPILPSRRTPLDRAAKGICDRDLSIDRARRRIPQEVEALLDWVALELCRTEKLWAAVNPLVRELEDGASAHLLVDLNLCAFFDPLTAGCLGRESDSPHVVLACVDPVAAILAISAALSSSEAVDLTRQRILTCHILPESLDVSVDIIEGVRRALAAEYALGINIDEVLRLAADPLIQETIYAVISVPDSVSCLLEPNVLGDAERNLGNAVRMVFVGDEPAEMANRLSLQLLGPGDELLAQYVTETQHLVTARDVLHRKVDLELSSLQDSRRRL